MARLKATHELSCPFLDEDDSRCARHFTLERLEEAFDQCLNGGYPSCPIYRQRLRELHPVEWKPQVHVTIEGREPAFSLRATGS